jgi:dTDP-4-amino-4,6-dideoxygalactose transaminase
MHLQPVFQGSVNYGGSVSEHLFENGLCLPSGSNMSSEDLSRVVEIVRRVLG